LVRNGAQFSQIAIGETKRELVEQFGAPNLAPGSSARDTDEKLGDVQAERDWSEKSSGSPEMPGWSATARLVKVRFGRTSWSELVSRTQCPRLE
jgi:hypothetical protein